MLQVVIFMLSLRVCVLSAHLLLQHYHREWTFYSFNQITMLFKHYPCYQILIIFFTFWVIFHCATNSHVEHIMAFVLIPCCQSKTCAEVGIFVLPSVEVVIWCCLDIKYWVGFLLSDIDTGAIHQNIYTRGVGSWTVLRSCQIFSLQSKSI